MTRQKKFEIAQTILDLIGIIGTLSISLMFGSDIPIFIIIMGMGILSLLNIVSLIIDIVFENDSKLSYHLAFTIVWILFFAISVFCYNFL